jgi:hypothetical protein
MNATQDKSARFTKNGIVISNGLLVAVAVWLHSELKSLNESRCHCVRDQVSASASHSHTNFLAKVSYE